MIEVGVFRHYKGGLYRVIVRSRDADTGAPLITYEDIGTGRAYTRDEREFEGSVCVRGQLVMRFTPRDRLL